MSKLKQYLNEQIDLVPFDPKNPSEEYKMVKKFTKKMGKYIDEIEQSENTDEFHNILVEVADMMDYYIDQWKRMDVTKNKDINKLEGTFSNFMKVLNSMDLKQPEFDKREHGDGFKLY